MPAARVVGCSAALLVDRLIRRWLPTLREVVQAIAGLPIVDRTTVKSRAT